MTRDLPPEAPDLPDRQLKAYQEAARKQNAGYSQPVHVNPVITEAQPMGELGQQIATTVKEIFYQYTNRVGRSAQEDLGPSQIGTPCDRRLVMHLLGMKPVNPGSDGWAAFVGTCIHAGLAEMFDWADAGKGRFATEVSLLFPNDSVPHGTADLLDRVLFMVDDHKAQGQWALDKLKREGPSETYRIQLHVYAYGARFRGERIDYVGLIAWPRDKGSLDDLYVWTETYDPSVARNALKRVDDLAKWVEGMKKLDGITDVKIASQAATADDCKYCPYHLKNAKDLTNGACKGHRP